MKKIFLKIVVLWEKQKTFFSVNLGSFLYTLTLLTVTVHRYVVLLYNIAQGYPQAILDGGGFVPPLIALDNGGGQAQMGGDKK